MESQRVGHNWATEKQHFHSNMPSPVLPQDLCICCSFSLEYLPPEVHVVIPFISSSSLLKCLLWSSSLFTVTRITSTLYNLSHQLYSLEHLSRLISGFFFFICSVIVWLSPLEYNLRTRMLSGSLTDPSSLPQCLKYSRHSKNVCWISELYLFSASAKRY